MILLLDDDLDILKAVERLFRTQKIALLTTTCALDALEILKKQKIKIVISDYQMKGTNGVDFLKKAKELQPSSTRIIFTAFSDLDIFNKDLENGTISQILTKPFQAQELIEEIKNIKKNKDAA